MLLSINHHKELYLKRETLQKNEDQTLVIEPLMNEQENLIDMGFGTITEGRKYFQNNGNDKDSDESDVINDETLCESYIEYDAEIENIFTSRSNSELGYLIVVA